MAVRRAVVASSHSSSSPTDLSWGRVELGLEIVESERPQDVQAEVQEPADLVDELLTGAEDVAVVLGEPRIRISP